MKKFYLLTKTLLVAALLMVGANAWAGAPVSGSDYLIKNVQTGYYLVGGIEWGTHACLHKMPQWFTFTGSDNVYTLDSHQFNNSTNHFLNTSLYVDQATTNWIVTETATPGVFTISNDGNYIAGNGVDVAITTTTDGTAAAAQWQLISYSDFVSTLEGEIGVSGVDATPYIKDPELKRNGNFTTYSGTKPWAITGYDGTGVPSNYSEGQDGNNASCAESFQSTTGFKFAQTLTGMKPGQYKLTAQAFYRQDGTDTDNYPYLFVGDTKSYFPEKSGTENNMVEAYASFLSGTYPVDPITFVVSSESDNVTIGYANANVKMWNIFGQTQLTYYGTALINDAKAFNNGGVMTAGQWYYFDATVAGTYEFTAGSDLTAISYTTDGTQVTSSATGTTLTASQALSATRYYFKSSSAQTLTVSVPAGAQIINADIDFSNAIIGTSPYTISGAVSSMTWTNQWTVTPSVADGMLRVGNFEGKVALTGAPAGTKDIVTLSFDYGHVGLTGKETMRFTVYDVDGGEIISEKLNVYDKTFSSNTLGLNAGNLVYVSSDNPGMVENNKNSYTIILNYETKKISGSVVNKNGTYPFEIDMPLGTKAVGSFSVGANINNYESRRSYFDNLLIKTVVGDYSTTKTITYAYKDDSDNDITDFMTSHGGMASDNGESDEEYTPLYPSSSTTDDYEYDYTYASGGDPFTVTDDATVTLVYTKSAHPTTDVTVQYKYSGVVKKEEVVAEGYPVGKPLSYGVHQYIVGNDGVFYQTSTGTNWYYRTANAAATIAENVTASGINNVVYFTEAEAVSDASSQDMTARASNGKLGYTTNSDTYVNATTLTPGKYIIYMRSVTANSGDRYFNFKVGDDKVFGYKQSGSNTNNVQNSDEFTVSSSSTLSFAADGGNANGNGLDWFYVVKTAEFATIGATGWTTFASAYPLNLTTLTASEGTATAYYASAASGSSVTMTSTTATVPAGEGLALKGTAGATVTIPVAASGDAISDNLLEGCTSLTELTANDKYYVLVNNNKTAEFQCLDKNGATIPAGKAYLDLTGVSLTPAPTLSIVFENEITGVETLNVERGTMNDNSYFNLAGQRVAQPTKGVYIQNGKKVVIK